MNVPWHLQCRNEDTWGRRVRIKRCLTRIPWRWRIRRGANVTSEEEPWEKITTHSLSPFFIIEWERCLAVLHRGQSSGRKSSRRPPTLPCQCLKVMAASWQTTPSPLGQCLSGNCRSLPIFKSTRIYHLQHPWNPAQVQVLKEISNLL